MDSSSSSSDCGFDESYCYGVDINTEDCNRAIGHPFFFNKTQPLVYCAQVPPPSKRQRSREIRNESPNCFVKAFRWYTQEHLPPQRNQFSNVKPNMNGFAAWLDTKYLQFMRESQLQQTSNLGASKTIKDTNSKKKKKCRVKSLWKKRRSPKKEGGDIFSLKSHHSFEYILQPKEMTRNISERCQPTPAILHNRSNVTIVPNDVCNCKNPVTKSLSLTSVYRDNNSNATYLNKVVLDEKRYTNDKAKLNKIIPNISCQCVVKIASKVSTGTQYENPFINTVISDEVEINSKLLSDKIVKPGSLKSLVEIPKKGTVRKRAQEFDPRRHVSCQCTDKTTKIDASCQCIASGRSNTNYGSQDINAPIKKRLPKQPKSVMTNTVTGSNALKIPVHSTAQTSDHPINLNNGLVQEYPFFMRIIRADKLCDDCITR